MFRFNNSSRFHGLMVALVTAATGAYGTACVAQEPAPAVVAAQAAATSAAGLATSSGFPYPIWKNRLFDDANNLAGVLLRTAQGPVQIKELKWFANQEGFINIGYLSAFNADGEPVTFGSPEGCLEQVTKEKFLGYAMTQADNFIESFDFVTDHAGYLAVGNPVIALQPEPEPTCGLRTVKQCVSAGCNGNCGFSQELLSLSPGGSGPAIHPDNEPFLQVGVPKPIDCECLGGEGNCNVQWSTQCAGTCPLPGNSCGATEDNGEPGCNCR